MKPFWNREDELERIRSRAGKPGFGMVTGRRRIGKTALLVEACRRFGGLYHQAVEGSPGQQLPHLTEEIGARLPIFKDIAPKSWAEFFRLLSREKLPGLIVFDEFPYWVEGDPALPSLLQKWIDHDLPKSKTLVILSGSSQSMLDSQSLRPDAPLHGRVSLRIRLQAMSYAWFCRALGYAPADPVSFTRFALVGGVPHYWKLMPRGTVLQQAESLYFAPSAILAEEPGNWIRDERITGNLPKAMLDLVGRGCCKPSELASRLGIPQGNLSRPLALLLDLGLIRRELPFGESVRTTKKVHYTIQDPALAFYYGTCLPNRGSWGRMGPKDRMARIDHHASKIWESYCRSLYPGAGRYWEGDAEIDLVAPLPGEKKFLVAECKWRRLSEADEKQIRADLRTRFLKTRLGHRLEHSSELVFKIFSKNSLEKMKREA